MAEHNGRKEEETIFVGAESGMEGGGELQRPSEVASSRKEESWYLSIHKNIVYVTSTKLAKQIEKYNSLLLDRVLF